MAAGLGSWAEVPGLRYLGSWARYRGLGTWAEVHGPGLRYLGLGTLADDGKSWNRKAIL